MIDHVQNMWLAATNLAHSPMLWVPLLTFGLTAISILLSGTRR